MGKMVFIITWTLVTIYVTAPEPTVDEYGRISHSTLAMGVVKTSTTEHSKTFEKFSDVEEWIKNCPFQKEDSFYLWGEAYVTDVRVNGVKIESMEDLIVSFPKGILK